jgi:nitric oxide reductase activation protein
LSTADLAEARRLSLTLKNRLQSFLQTQTVKVNHPGIRGRLDTGSLYKLSIGNVKVFRRSGVRLNLDTAVYLLLDASGSMAKIIRLVNLAAYGLADACQGPPGLVLGVGVFPGDYDVNTPDSVIKTILRPGERLHPRFKFEASGGTPMAEALRQVAKQMAPWRQKRKIVIMLTDGVPSSPTEVLTALGEMGRQGMEVFGLGIEEPSILDLLPDSSAVIYDLRSLPTALFRILGESLRRR